MTDRSRVAAERVLAGPECIAEGAAWLADRDAGLARARDEAGPWPDRLRPGGFPALVGAIVSQQVSVASARAIGAREMSSARPTSTTEPK